VISPAHRERRIEHADDRGAASRTTHQKDSTMNLKRAAAVAAILLLAVPAAAYAGGWTDSAGTDGQIITGTKLVTGVGGDVNAGAISVRFADKAIPLFYRSSGGVDVVNAPGMFAIHESGNLYSPWGPYSPWGTTFSQTSAPVTTGAGTVASPWVVTSGFQTRGLTITQKVSHVDGSRALTLSWKVTNTTVGNTAFSAFWNADLYVAGSDLGTGALVSGPPRTLEGIAANGTKVGLVELTPWSHYFEGDYYTATAPSFEGKASYNDTIDRSRIDNGFGVEWDRMLAAHASTTFVLGFNAAEPGSAPPPEVAPDITRQPVNGSSRTATFRFVKHAGDTATVSYECSLDGGQYQPCTSPETYGRVALGEHVFRVHGVNVNGATGPAASAMWTITPVQVAAGSHPSVSLPAVAVAARRLPVACNLGGGTIARCTVTLVGPGGVVVGRGHAVYRTGHRHRHAVVSVLLTRKGRLLAAQPGGVRVVATAKVLPAGGSKPLVARQTVHVVAPSVDVTPGALQFQTGSAVLLPGGVAYLQRLMPQLRGASTVLASGYTDNLGTPAFNLQLGLDRAQAVCTFIQQHAHVACVARSFGQTHPRATNATAAGRALNRRVELKVTY
jgi:outer membrane protein OmpA-like peptidoglycan-associated protein